MLVIIRKILLNIINISRECFSLIKVDYSFYIYEGNDVIIGYIVYYWFFEYMNVVNELFI